MELRKEIETLAIWYIPAVAFVLIATAFLTGYAQEIMRDQTASPGTLFSFLSLAQGLIHSVDNLVVGIWLFLRSSKEDGRRYLWSLFGLAAHLFAAIVYLALRIYEQRKESI